MSFIDGYDIISVMPFLVACGFGMLVLLLEVFQRESASRSYLAWVAAVGFAVMAYVAYFLMRLPQQSVFGGMNAFDGFAGVLTIVFAIAGAGTSLVAPQWLSEHRVDRGEFYALLLFSAGGMSLMVSATDFVVFFIALEIMSIAVYALAAYSRWDRLSSEAGFKYFILGAFASGLLLYGIALLYGATGSTNYAVIGELFGDGAVTGASAMTGRIDAAVGAAISGNALSSGTHVTIGTIGIILIVVAFAFKIAAAPFHMWAPDAYTGAPTPVVGFMAAAVKAASLAALVRIIDLAFMGEGVRLGEYGWVQIAVALAFLSMVVGNLVALVQDNVKRMLAYSSVAHAGYLLIGIVALGSGNETMESMTGIVAYLIAYVVGTVGSFGALAWLGKRNQECKTYEDLNGLGYKHPWVGFALTIFMFSTAGIPPSIGFVGKFMVFKSAIQSAAAGGAMSTSLIVLVVAGVLLSLAGIYYYLRVVVHLYMKEGDVRTDRTADWGGTRIAVGLFALATLFYGIFPGNVVDASRYAAQMRVTPAQVTLEHDKMDAKIKAFTRDNAEEEDDRVRDTEPSE
jgi:NADH-quinone oxidoreductase subunit N